MEKLFKIIILLASLTGLSVWGGSVYAAACTSAATGNWSAAATWAAPCNVAGGPTAADTVTIANGHTITVDTAAACSTLTFPAVALPTGITIIGTNSLAVTGLVSMARPAVGGSSTIDVGAGTLSAGSLTMSATNGAARINTLSISTGSATIAGAATTSGVASRITFTGAGALTFAGARAGAATLTTAAGSTINYAGAAQTGIVGSYANLTLSGSGVKTFATTPTVNGVLSMEGTATVTVTGAGVVTYGANAALQYNTASARTVSAEEWGTPFAATGGVIIANTGTITLNAAKVLNASVPLTINSGATLATGNFQLTLGGNFINNGGTLTAGSSPIVIANTMAAQSIAGFTTTGLVSVTKTAGTATFAGNVNGAGLTINGAGGTLNLGSGLTHTFAGAWTTTAGALNGGSSSLNVGGNCSAPPPGATFTAGTGTVNWNAAGAQSVCQYAYFNLGLSGSGAKTMTGVTAVGGNLSISGTATMTANAAFTVTGALNYSSTGATTLTAATPVSIGSFNQSAGTLTDNGNTITVTGTGAGTWTQSGGTFTPTGTVTFTGAAPQISASSFNNLTINIGAGNTATLTGNATSGGTLTLTSGTLAVGANTLTLNGPTIAGTPANLSTTSSSSLVFGGTSAGVQMPGSVNALNNLNVNNINGITLNSSPVLSGTLTLVSGIITTGANTLEVASSCATGISGGAAATFVLGNLSLHYPIGNTTCTFPIGSAAAYTPTTVAMNGVTSILAASGLTARTDAGDHADTTAGASGIDATKSVNRYWTLTPGALLTFTTYDTTFTFMAGDIDGGAATASFIIGRKNGVSWSYPTMGAKNPTNITATGMTQAGGFGVYVIGERTMPSITVLKTVAIYWDPINLLVNPKFIPGAAGQFTIISSNAGGPADKDLTYITDPIPANTSLYVNDIGGPGPVLFSQGATSSTLAYTFNALNDLTDDVDFSNDGGTTWTAVPVAGADGCDATITNIRINPKGTFVGSAVVPQPSFQLGFRVCVK